MSIASFILGMVLATLYGTLFHLWRGGGPGKILLYLILSWAGFLTGHLVATSMEISFDKIGELHVGIASLGSLIFLGLGYWLSLVQEDQKPHK